MIAYCKVSVEFTAELCTVFAILLSVAGLHIVCGYAQS